MIHSDGFEWINEGKTPEMPKWGFVSDVPERFAKFQVNTKSTFVGNSAKVNVELGFLRSYENMGRAAVSCEGGCSCEPWTLDGHHEQHNSQTFLHAFQVSQAEECVIVVRILHVSVPLRQSCLRLQNQQTSILAWAGCVDD